MIRLALFADIHGKFLLPFKLAHHYQQTTGRSIDLIVQCGNMGAFPDKGRMDKATLRHAARDRDELGFMDNFRGCTRLALNSTPIPQDFKLLRRCAEAKPKFAFFQEQREGFAINSVVFAQDAFCLIPKILNAVNVVLAVCKFLGMGDAVMDKTTHVQLVVAAQTIGINNTVRHDFLFDNRHQSIGLGIIYDNGIDPSVAFQNAKDNHFSCRAATMSAFTLSAEIAFVQLDRALKNLIGNQGQIMADNHTNFAVEQNSGVGLNAQNIGSGTGGNFEYKKTKQFFLYFFL